VIDPGVQCFLLAVTRAAAAGHLDAKGAPRVAIDPTATLT
jgi:hypothetical protein